MKMEAKNSEDPLLKRIKCTKCYRSFSSVSNLNRHVNTKHKGVQQFRCTECSKVFLSNGNLKRHAKLMHKGVEHIGGSHRVFKFKCDKCPYRFNAFRNLRFHTKNVHGERFREDEVKCLLCNMDVCKKDFCLHLERAHEVSVENVTVTFNSHKDFLDWKMEEEINTKTKFVKHSAGYNVKRMKKENYYCHRSGKYVSDGKGQRKLKAQGSNKINGFCPARMTVNIDKDEQCTVVYTKTHVGHDNDLRHLTLTSAEREDIASKIAAKVSFDSILDEIRNASSGELKRRHLLTKKDLENIKSSLNMRSDVLQQKESPVENDESGDASNESFCLNLEIQDNDSNCSVISEQLPTEKCADDLQTKKEKLRKQFDVLLNKSASLAEVQYLESLLKQGDSKIIAMQAENS